MILKGLFFLCSKLNFLEKFKILKRKNNFLNLVKRLNKYGDSNTINTGIKILYPERVDIGSYVYIGPNAYINGLGNVDIKSGVIIGPNLIIHSANHNYKNSKYIPYDENFDFRKVIINENVWVGGNVIIAPGAEIGEGSIIGAGAVVSGKIPKLSIVVGNPCRVIKSRNEEHYYRLKKENKIYGEHKIKGNIVPNTNNQ